MDDEERKALAEKLDRELEDYVASKVEESKNKRKDKSPERQKTVDEVAEELKQHPFFMTDYDESKPMSWQMEGLQSIKYDAGQDNEDAALGYKEDGNKNFKLKKYRWAIDNYTAGINCKTTNDELNAVLFTNRAMANFLIGNFLSAFNDCVMARKFKPNHMKAILKGVQCSIERQTYAKAVSWCDEGLSVTPGDKTLLELRRKADQLLSKQEKDRRKEKAKEKKEAQAEGKLLEAIAKRKITLATEKGLDEEGSEGDTAPSLTLSSLESCHPSRAIVTLDAEGVLHWPVLFLYPEFGETDFITSFCENSRFVDHLESMFGADVERPAWDKEARYTPETLEIHFEDRERTRLHRVKQTSTLLSVLQDPRYTVRAGTPSFYCLVKDSSFAKQFLASYC